MNELKTNSLESSHVYRGLETNCRALYSESVNEGVKIRIKDKDLSEKIKRLVLSVFYCIKSFCCCHRSEKYVLSNRECILKMIKASHGHVFQYLDPIYRGDKELILGAVKAKREWDLRMRYCSRPPLCPILEHIDPSLQKNKKFIMDIFRIDGSEVSYLDSSLENDEEVALAAIKSNPNVIQFVHTTLLNNKEFIVKAIKQGGVDVYRSLDDSQIECETVVEALLEVDVKQYIYLPRKLHGNKQIAFKAIAKEPWILSFAPLELRNDHEFCLSLLKVDTAKFYPHLLLSVKTDEVFLSKAIKQNYRIYFILPDHLKKISSVYNTYLEILASVYLKRAERLFRLANVTVIT